MQMLSVVSGAEIMQDIPTWFTAQNLDYAFEHRNEKATPDSYRDYAPHSVQVAADSLLKDIWQTEVLTGCPSWHHQAVLNVDNTRLRVTGFTETCGVQMIEAVERMDKTFALGLQFHPEAAVVKHLDNAENRDAFMDYETAMILFRWLVNSLPEKLEKAS